MAVDYTQLFQQLREELETLGKSIISLTRQAIHSRFGNQERSFIESQGEAGRCAENAIAMSKIINEQKSKQLVSQPWQEKLMPIVRRDRKDRTEARSIFYEWTEPHQFKSYELMLWLPDMSEEKIPEGKIYVRIINNRTEIEYITTNPFDDSPQKPHKGTISIEDVKTVLCSLTTLNETIKSEYMQMLDITLQGTAVGVGSFPTELAKLQKLLPIILRITASRDQGHTAKTTKVANPRTRGFVGLVNEAGNCQNVAGLAYIIARILGSKIKPHSSNLGVAFCACYVLPDSNLHKKTGFKGVHYFIAIGCFNDIALNTCVVPNDNIFIIDPWLAENAIVPASKYFCSQYGVKMQITKFSSFARHYDERIMACYDKDKDPLIDLKKLQEALHQKYASRLKEPIPLRVGRYISPFSIGTKKIVIVKSVCPHQCCKYDKVIFLNYSESDQAWFISYKDGEKIKQVDVAKIEGLSQYLTGLNLQLLPTGIYDIAIQVKALIIKYLYPYLSKDDDIFIHAAEMVSNGSMFTEDTICKLRKISGIKIIEQPESPRLRM